MVSRNLLFVLTPCLLALSGIAQQPAATGPVVATAIRIIRWQTLPSRYLDGNGATSIPVQCSPVQSKYLGNAGIDAKSSGECCITTRAFVFAAIPLKRPKDASVSARLVFTVGTSPSS